LEVCLLQKRSFACLFRHALSDFLPSLFAAEFWSGSRADAKTRITVPVINAEAARD
jgi:hypothetical protein